MKYKVMLPLFLLSCIAFGIAAQTDSDKAKDQINQGLQAVTNARYESAVEHFRQARKLDPQSLTGAQYLAGALALVCIPGVETPENVKLGDEAIDTYKQILAMDPQNVSAFKWIGFLEFNLRRLEQAKSYYHQAAQAAPNDSDAVYSVGVL
ncbi:MAG TPA: tetratricopeptide repeat protein, partial [Candidatus Angelobacter sp.]|nr:tetratricopeptide repeat protein [Candidatus Angelobacter sp.]